MIGMTNDRALNKMVSDSALTISPQNTFAPYGLKICSVPFENRFALLNILGGHCNMFESEGADFAAAERVCSVGARCSAVAGVSLPLGTVTSTFSSGLCSGAVAVPSCALTAPSLGSAAVATSASLTVRALAFAAFSVLCVSGL